MSATEDADWECQQRYAPGEQITESAFWQLLEARESITGRRVVLKVFRSTEPEARSRFDGKLGILSQLNHPGVAPVLAVGETPDGRPYYATKYLEGTILRRVLDGIRNADQQATEQFPLVRLLEEYLKACETVRYAHAQGQVHGALDTTRLLIGPCGELTVTGWGSTPEGATQADDVRALGAILYAIVTLQEFSEPGVARAMLQNVRTSNILGPACPRQELPIALTVVIELGVGLGGGRVYAEAAELQEDVDALVEGNAADPVVPVAAQVPSPEPARGWSGLSLGLGGLAVILVAVLAQQTSARLQLAARLNEWVVSEERDAVEKLQAAPEFVELAREAIVLDDLQQAELQIDAALSYAPGLHEALLLRADVQTAENRFADAVESLDQYLKERPDDQMAVKMRDTLLRARNVEEAAPDDLDALAAMLRQRDLGLLAGRFERGIHQKREQALSEFAHKHPQIAKLLEIDERSYRAALDLSGTVLEDLSILRGLPLWELILDRTQVASVAPLVGMQLHSLSLQKCPIRDLTPLANLPLRKLSLAETKIRRIDALAGTQLTDLNLADTRVRDLTPLRGVPLELLALTGAPVTDLSPLKGMPLQYLNLGDTAVKDLSPLVGMPLEYLRLPAYAKDLSAIRKLPLKHLNLSGAKVQNLMFLEAMSLDALVANYTQVRDLTPLKGQPLTMLRIEGTPVMDLTPIAELPLQTLVFEPEKITTGLQRIRGKKSIRRLGWSRPLLPPEAFWQAYDEGRQVIDQSQHYR